MLTDGRVSYIQISSDTTSEYTVSFKKINRKKDGKRISIKEVALF